jgi:purine nucleosidase
MSRVFLIDTDTASDDAVALIMAIQAPDVRVAAITTVAGNVSVQRAASNALYTLELCGSDVPVHSGAEKPLLRAHQNAHWFHGSNGLGEHSYPSPRRVPEKIPAAEAIIETIEANPGLVVVTLGPLTNLALALALKPSVVAKVGRCVIMGGAPCCEGNVTPAAEFNMWVDPEAARMVFHSGLRIELVGWHLSRGEAVLNPGDIEVALSLCTERARFALECNRRAREAYFEQTGEDGISLPDPVAMCIALDPSIGILWSEHYVEIETVSELTRGMTVIDRLNVAGNSYNRAVWTPLVDGLPKTKIWWTIDSRRWKQALYGALR